MESDNRQTCGKGLAANAGLPDAIARLLWARAEVLERHIKALDQRDPAARPELDAYKRLVEAHWEIAGQLSDLAREMSGYADLPMANHDPAVMKDPKGQAEAFSRFVQLERELADYLGTRLRQEEALLQETPSN